MNKALLLLPALLLSASCGRNTQTGSIEKWKQEVIQAEHDFARMAADSGIQAAFLKFAAYNAVLMRGNKLVIGRDEIISFFAKQPIDDSSVSLAWEPDFVEVSGSGDLAYTYGKYIYTYTDSGGEKQESTGIFHTVWKRQPDGSWRFVWD